MLANVHSSVADPVTAADVFAFFSCCWKAIAPPRLRAIVAFLATALDLEAAALTSLRVEGLLDGLLWLS